MNQKQKHTKLGLSVKVVDPSHQQSPGGCCCLAREAFEKGHSLDHGWTALELRPNHPMVCVFLWGPQDQAQVKQEVAHFDWACPEVVQ